MGTLSNDDDGRQWKRRQKNEFAFFQTWLRLFGQMLATFPGVEFLRILFSWILEEQFPVRANAATSKIGNGVI